MSNYKMAVQLMSASFFLFSPSLLSKEKEKPLIHKRVMYKMESPYIDWWRDQLYDVWDSKIISVERRKKFTPDTIRLASFSTTNAVGGFVNLPTDIMAFPDKPVYLNKIKKAFTARPLVALAHEYVHFAKDDVGSFSWDYNLIDEMGEADEDNHISSDDKESLGRYFKVFREGKGIITFNQSNGVLPGDDKIDGVLTDDEQKDKRFIIYRECYADLKGLELLQHKSPDAYHTHLHITSNHYGNNFSRCCSGKYLDFHELLFCWGLYQQRKNDLHTDADLILHGVIDHYLDHRDHYNDVMKSLKFLKNFNSDRKKSWQGTVERWNPVKHSEGASEFVAGASCIIVAIIVGAVLLGIAPLIPLLALLGGSSILAVGYYKKDELVGAAGSLLGRAYNSSRMWNRNKFETALDTDLSQVETRVQELIKEEQQRKVEEEKEKKLFVAQQETDSVRLFFEQFNSFD